MILTLKKNGLRKQVKIGFSWTTFFFGPWVPLLRGMWLQLFIFWITFGLAGFYYIFKINAIYGRKLIEDGWEISEDDVSAAAVAWGVGV